jgi:hypothetical protein
MPKPKAPRWLTESFRAGVDARQAPGGVRLRPAYPGAYPSCWLAHHDPRRRPCTGPMERFHFVNRQRVEGAMWEQLREAMFWEPDAIGPHGEYAGMGRCLDRAERDELILIAAWDDRLGGLGCEGHHRRLDSHLTPALEIVSSALPAHLIDWSEDYGLEQLIAERFPSP